MFTFPPAIWLCCIFWVNTKIISIRQRTGNLRPVHIGVCHSKFFRSHVFRFRLQREAPFFSPFSVMPCSDKFFPHFSVVYICSFMFLIQYVNSDVCIRCKEIMETDFRQKKKRIRNESPPYQCYWLVLASHTL